MKDKPLPTSPVNPNNCHSCGHKTVACSGWCYMFKQEPTDSCSQHTGRLKFGFPLSTLKTQLSSTGQQR